MSRHVDASDVCLFLFVDACVSVLPIPAMSDPNAFSFARLQSNLTPQSPPVIDQFHL